MAIAAILVDTNVVSFIMKDAPEGRLYHAHLKDKLAAISFITVGEMYYGAEKASWGIVKRRGLEETLKKFIVIPYDHMIARQYGVILAACDRLGRPIFIPDAWIAACACRHSIPLVTHNPRHFEMVPGLTVLSEWRAE